jgi:hypothetical protein
MSDQEGKINLPPRARPDVKTSSGRRTHAPPRLCLSQKSDYNLVILLLTTMGFTQLPEESMPLIDWHLAQRRAVSTVRL